MAERHVIIVGFGLSGRSTVNNVIEQNVSYTVIEMNEETVDRCTKGGLNIIFGDAREEEILRAAGIERATDVAITIPMDDIVLAVIGQVKRLNPAAKIIARCTFGSDGMEATQRGADEVIIAEQVVATEFGRAINAAMKR